MAEALRLIADSASAELDTFRPPNTGSENAAGAARSLSQLVSDGLPFELELRVLVEALAVLSSRHTNIALRPEDRYHGDVHPENMYVTYRGKVVLSTSEVGQSFRRPTHYLAPEQEQATHVDQQADIYALGLILYECLTGARVATQDKPSLRSMVETGAVSPRDQAESTRALLRVAARAVAGSPSERWSSAREFAAELELHARSALGSRDNLEEWVVQGKQSEPLFSSLDPEMSNTNVAAGEGLVENQLEVFGLSSPVGCEVRESAAALVVQSEANIVFELRSRPLTRRRSSRWFIAAGVVVTLGLGLAYWLDAAGGLGGASTTKSRSQLLDTPQQAPHHEPQDVDFQRTVQLAPEPAQMQTEPGEVAEAEPREAVETELSGAAAPEQPSATTSEKSVTAESGAEAAVVRAAGAEQSSGISPVPAMRSRPRRARKPASQGIKRERQPAAAYEPEGI